MTGGPIPPEREALYCLTRPGFGVPFQPALNVDRTVVRSLRTHLEAFRDGAGPDIDILLDLGEFLPFFRAQAMDVAIVDAVWNGVWQAMKIAVAADAHEVNVAPLDFYGHLSTFMNLHFAAAVPNLRIMEINVDRLAWDAEIFTVEPKIENGELVVPDTPGWGTEPVDEAIRAHPPKGSAGLLGYKDK